jgi:aryl-phospho-beta-D-glucosidase BglC (GH1 family)
MGAMLRAWERVAETLCDGRRYWNFFGADLRNEPYRAHWGGADDGERWDTVAARLGDAVLRKCPRLLIFVEGVSGCAAPVEARTTAGRMADPCPPPVANVQRFQAKEVGTFYGENLMGGLLMISARCTYDLGEGYI